MTTKNRMPVTMTPRVELRQSPALTADEARRRRRQAYAWLTGIEPWPNSPTPRA